MKRYLAAIQLIVLTRAAFGGAQPILNEDNTISRLLGLSVEETTFGTSQDDAVVQLIARTGADQTWDVTMVPLSSAESTTTYYSAPNGSMPIIHDPRLEGTNLVGISASPDPTWTYRRIDATGDYLLGRVILKDVNHDGLKDTLTTMYDPPSTVFPFPLTMGSAWADSSTQTLEIEGSPPVPTETDVAFHTVEGWGSLIAPEGSSPVLRIRTVARITNVTGEKKTYRIRLVAPVPDGLMDRTVYASGIEIMVDSLDAPLSFSYVSHTVSLPTSIANTPLIATAFSLGPNYPNPFNARTTIPFEVAQTELVRITIFDMVGRRTAVLLDRTLTPGPYEMTWDAGLVPSGVYRVVLESDQASVSRAIVLSK